MLQIRIVSNTGTVYEGKVAHVTFPGEAGSFAVYPMHAPLISSLVKGDIVCYPANNPAGGTANNPVNDPANNPTDGKKKVIAVQSGFVEVNADRITACIE